MSKEFKRENWDALYIGGGEIRAFKKEVIEGELLKIFVPNELREDFAKHQLMKKLKIRGSGDMFGA